MSTTEYDVTTVIATDGPPTVEKLLFSWLDYSLFAIMLGISALIGVYFGCFGKKQDSPTEYILGGKAMKTFPIAMSLVASQISGITVLAVPADIYAFGASYWLCAIAIILTGIFTAYVFLPVFHKLQLNSSYEYLKHRFDNRMRLLSSFLYLFSLLIYMPLVIYIPALAFSQVTGLNTHMITPVVCIVCIFYTTLGGLKAVVWTDTLQFSIMIIAMFAVLFLGVKATGSMAYIFQKSYEGGRLDIWDFDLDPTNRTSFWSVIIGMATTWTSYTAVSQSCIQKFLAVPTITSAKWSVFIFVVGVMVVKSMSSLTGIIIYAKYADCDPITTKNVAHVDQMLPYFIMDVAGNIPGFPGLFIAGVFCAALSTLSASLNTLSGVIYEDFIKRFMPKNTTEKRASDIMKIIVIVVGILSTAMVFIVEHLGSILPLSVSFGGMINGPLLGMFTLGMVIPFANSKGTMTGTISGLAFIGWIVFGAQYYKAQGVMMTPKLPISIEGCDFSVDFIANVTTVVNDFQPLWIYRISFYYYGLVGFLTTVSIGIVMSLLTGGRNQKIDRDLLSPVIYFALPKEDYKTVERAMKILVTNHKDEETIQR